ncbi:coniferyl aldehyde dehydrogenase [Undibacterium sp.]|jgi:coniferyl-aldehyde dehydrogenase|uniref:coniferyl aldehyde dehydrogenase n=1 Tax=Undibacterium sp. TaxID=1914977 RepID=UPI002D16A1A2|nr:coniferyl aldehyde dehydrogenase [Undibacterium sp.]HTD06008.1 coniferyl aldehyde dehydrogenase [Undibacterium sp.]
MSAVLREASPPVTEAQRLLALQKNAYLADMTPSRSVRLERLGKLKSMTEKHADAIVAAIAQDFGHRSAHETRLAEIMMSLSAIKHTMRRLGKWMRPRRAPTALPYRPAYNRIMLQPLGVVGIVAPWNYPYQLAIGPAIGALAAGNRVMIKPSELCPRLSELLQRIVAETFDEDEVAVVTGGVAVGQAFTELPFDHLVFTGSTAVGRLVAQAAARNLTPVTLELGGKSPAILDESCDIRHATTRLTQGKLFNAGQTCIAPDYVFVPQDKRQAFVTGMQDAARKMYPSYLDNPDYTSIVNEKHFERLQSLLDDARLKGAQIIPMGTAAPLQNGMDHRMTPTLVLDVTDGMKIMQEEIFGPLLPVKFYQDQTETIHYINRHQRPLALYWFGTDAARRNQVLQNTISGGVTINDCLWHFGQEEQPFGGVGASGMGAYHGEHGFRTFSKEKPVFFQSRFSGLPLLYPPYGKVFEMMFKLLKKIA